MARANIIRAIEIYYHYFQPQLPSYEVVRMDMTSLLGDCQCGGPEHCLLYFSVEQTARETATNWLLLTDFITATGLSKASIKVKLVNC